MSSARRPRHRSRHELHDQGTGWPGPLHRWQTEVRVRRCSRSIQNSASALVQRLRTPGLCCRFGPDLSGLGARQSAQPTCVGHRVTVSVLIEVGEDAKAFTLPFADAVGPPVQIGFTVRASVKVIMGPGPAAARKPLSRWLAGHRAGRRHSSPRRLPGGSLLKGIRLPRLGDRENHLMCSP
jgi:hypothetical protein